MIEVKASKATGVQIEGHGNPLEQAEDIINIISAVHNGFLMAQDMCPPPTPPSGVCCGSCPRVSP